MGDDAIGPSVVRWMQAHFDFPDTLLAEDLGTPGLELPSHIAGLDRVVFVDAVASEEPPGTILRYDRAEILRYGPGLRLGPHDPAIRESLLALDLTELAPADVVLIGVVPRATANGLSLSPEVRDAIPAAAAAVLRELERFGIRPRRKAVPQPADLWWEAVPVA